jgi:hypothetical protein
MLCLPKTPTMLKHIFMRVVTLEAIRHCQNKGSHKATKPNSNNNAYGQGHLHDIKKINYLSKKL